MSGYYIDRKYTVWERQYFESDETPENILVNLKKFKDFGNGYNERFEIITDTFDAIDPEDNGGESTVELYNIGGELMWSNTTVDDTQVKKKTNKI